MMQSLYHMDLDPTQPNGWLKIQGDAYSYTPDEQPTHAYPRTYSTTNSFSTTLTYPHSSSNLSVHTPSYIPSPLLPPQYLFF